VVAATCGVSLVTPTFPGNASATTSLTIQALPGLVSAPFSRDGTHGVIESLLPTGDGDFSSYQSYAIASVSTGIGVTLPRGYRPLALSGNGGVVLVTRPNGTLVRRDLASGAELSVPMPSNLRPEEVLDPSEANISGDGLVVVFYMQSIPWRRAFVTTMTGAPVDITAGLVQASFNRRAGFASLSESGRYVVFTWANFIAGCTVPSDPDCHASIERFDRESGVSSRVDVNPDGQATPSFFGAPAMSDDGRFVAFSSNSTSIVPGLASGHPRIFLRDLLAKRTSVVAEMSTSSFPTDLSMSGNAQRIAFGDIGEVFIPGTQPIGPVVRVASLTDGSMSQIRAVGGGATNGYLEYPFVSQSGDRVLFRGLAPNITSPPTADLSAFSASFFPVSTPGSPLVFSSGERLDPSALISLNPSRLLDTRATGQIGYSGSKPVAGQTVSVAIPDGASGAVLNITGLDASAAGFVTVFPCGEPVPTASNLNLLPGRVSPNLVIAKVGANGKVCLFTNQSANLIADMSGIFPVGSGFNPITPNRILDTRPGEGKGYSGPKPDAGQVIKLVLPDAPGAAVLNVTALDAAAAGFVTVYPCGEARPNTSNLNLIPGVTSPNMAIAKTSSGVCLWTGPAAHLIVDVLGSIPAGPAYTPITPVRILDTRKGGPVNHSGDKPATGATVEVPVPTGIAAAAINVTGLDADTAGFVTVFPCGQAIPNASNLNLQLGTASPNLVISKVGGNGKVCIFSGPSANLIVDLVGTFAK
jgi:hypothetical protein